MKLPRLLAVLLLACRATPRRDAAGAFRLPACYRLAAAAWRDSLGPGFPSSAAIPSLLRLDSARAGVAAPDPRRHLFAASAILADGRASRDFTEWMVERGDSILVGTLPAPFGGYFLRLPKRGGDLSGRAAAVTDVLVPGRPTEVAAPLRAVRIECSTAFPRLPAGL